MATARVLVTGASGLLGRAILAEFQAAPDWEALGLAFSRAKDGLRRLDLTDCQALRELVTEFKPKVIIHSAAERRPDVVEKQAEKTQKLNVEATENLCKVAGEVGAWVLFISTDYVFDGKSPPYKHTDTPNPLNKYGLSKREGEKVTLAASPESAVLRVPILYGPVESLEESAVTVLFPKVKDTSTPCVMSDYERRYPTHTHNIAKVIVQLSRHYLAQGKAEGVFHWSGTQNMTKYDMALAMAQAFGISTDHIQADKSPSGGATRPYDAHLDSSRLQELGIGSDDFSDFQSCIKDVLQPFMSTG